VQGEDEAMRHDEYAAHDALGLAELVCSGR
jgi:hypothetical protein